MPGSDGPDRRKEKRTPIGLLVKVGYETTDEFVEKYALNLSHQGLFIRSREPKPIGTPVKVEIRLKSGDVVLRGEGVVRWVEQPHTSAPPGNPGMGVEFSDLDPKSKAVLDRMLEQMREQEKAESAAQADFEAQAEVQAQLEAQALQQQAQAAVQAQIEAQAAAAPAPAPRDVPGAKKKAPPKPRKDAPHIGIDLGTTYSAIAVAKAGKAEIIPSRQGYRTMPSVIALNPDDGRLLVGHPARAQMVRNPKNSVYGSKRLIGLPYASPTVQACRKRYTYEIVPGTDGAAAVEIGGTTYALEEVAAKILAELKTVAEERLKETVERVVISVPAYYTDRQRAAVRKAGELAGMWVDRIVNEPTAAALSYGFDKQLDRRILIYDLGGGTFDVSILEVYGNVYEVVSTGGDTFLGGVDFDNALVDHLAREFKRAHGLDLPDDRVVHERLREAAERAKIELSERNDAEVAVPYLMEVSGEPKDLRTRLTRAQLEQLTALLVDRTLDVAGRVLGVKGFTAADIQEVLLVGGQTRMPIIWKRIQERFGREPHKGVHPDEAVALGAALLAAAHDRIDSVVLIDVLPIAIGVATQGGAMHKVIPRNSTLPASGTYTTVMAQPDQDVLEVAVFQGDTERAAAGEYLGTVTLRGLRGPAGMRVVVTFTLGEECVLSVAAKETATGRAVEAVFAMTDTPKTLKAKFDIPEELSDRLPRLQATPEAAPAAVAGADSPAAPDAAKKEEADKPGFLKRLFGIR